jgi:hypothetical protein
MECKWCHVPMPTTIEGIGLDDCTDCRYMKFLMRRNLQVAAHMLSALFVAANTERGKGIDDKARSDKKA